MAAASMFPSQTQLSFNTFSGADIHFFHTGLLKKDSVYTHTDAHMCSQQSKDTWVTVVNCAYDQFNGKFSP